MEAAETELSKENAPKEEVKEEAKPELEEAP